jgi:hypothetical protein
MIQFSGNEINKIIIDWLVAWNSHDLEGVLSLLHDEIEFENWTGVSIRGKNQLRKEWRSWFLFHGNFRFQEEDIFFDREKQKLLLQWNLEWPSAELKYKGKIEVRRGVDVIHFMDGKILKKYSYSKTTLKIGGCMVSLSAG